MKINLTKHKVVDWLTAFSLVFLTLLVVVSFLAPHLASDSPSSLFQFNPNQTSAQSKIFQPPGFTEIHNGKSYVHYLGTDGVGRDVASRVIHGTWTALSIGVFASLISLLIAIILGTLSGYFGNRSIRLNGFQWVAIIGVLLIASYYANEWAFGIEGDFSLPKFVLAFCLILLFSLWPISKLSFKGIPSYYIPFDTIVLRSIELFRSLPRLFLYIAIFSIVRDPSLLGVIFIIGILRWPSMTRLLRAEIMAARQQNYVLASIGAGMPPFKIILNHVLPNVISPLLVATAFNMATAILIESSLSFLQIGLSADHVSWGRMLGESRQYFQAWWMAIVPGTLIFLSVLSFNRIGDKIQEHLGPNARQMGLF